MRGPGVVDLNAPVFPEGGSVVTERKGPRLTETVKGAG